MLNIRLDDRWQHGPRHGLRRASSRLCACPSIWAGLRASASLRNSCSVRPGSHNSTSRGWSGGGSASSSSGCSSGSHSTRTWSRVLLGAGLLELEWKSVDLGRWALDSSTLARSGVGGRALGSTSLWTELLGWRPLEIIALFSKNKHDRSKA